MFKMTIETENSKGEIKIERRMVLADQVETERDFYRASTPRGCTRTIRVQQYHR